jgi:hypothetical protein
MLAVSGAASYKIAEYLLEHGADRSLHQKNGEGRTASDLVPEDDDDVLELLDKYFDKEAEGDDDNGPVCTQYFDQCCSPSNAATGRAEPRWQPLVGYGG